MFIAVKYNGEKIYAYKEEKDYLRALSDTKELFCPYCNKHVIFHGGPIITPHFKHERDVECSNQGEDETEEHLEGKFVIYNWLKKKYPDAKSIKLEHRITETNQIADVYAEFNDGRKFAFEIQCAKLTIEE